MWNGSTQMMFPRFAVSEKGGRAVEWTYFPRESLLLQLTAGTVCSRQPILVPVPQRRLGPLRVCLSWGWGCTGHPECKQLLFHFLPLPLLLSWDPNSRTRLLRGREPDSDTKEPLPSTTAIGHAPEHPCRAGPGVDPEAGLPLSAELRASCKPGLGGGVFLLLWGALPTSHLSGLSGKGTLLGTLM